MRWNAFGNRATFNSAPGCVLRDLAAEKRQLGDVAFSGTAEAGGGRSFEVKIAVEPWTPWQFSRFGQSLATTFTHGGMVAFEVVSDWMARSVVI